MHKFYHYETESLFNDESSSLISALTDPGPTLINNNNNNNNSNNNNNNIDDDDVEKKNENDTNNLKKIDNCELAVKYYNNKSNLIQKNNSNKNKLIDDSIIKFKQIKLHNENNEQKNLLTIQKHYNLSTTNESEKKKPHHIHCSDTDLRKMRPIITSPFMPTLAIDHSATHDRRRNIRNIDATTTAVSLTTTTPTPTPTPSRPKSVVNPTLKESEWLEEPSSVKTSISICPSLIKSLGPTKYSTLPLKKIRQQKTKKTTARPTTKRIPPKKQTTRPQTTEPQTPIPQTKIIKKTTKKTTPGINNNKVPIKAPKNVDEEDENESSMSYDSESTIYISFSQLTKKQWATVAMLAIANLCSTIAFSCIAPFYPDEAQRKGMNTFEIGIVFGVFELVMFFSAPILGKYMGFIGSKKMFTFGLLISGLTEISFGFLNFLPSNYIFFWASLTVRFAEALGDACFVTSSFAISAKCFPGRIATIVGVMETFAGLGYTAGPVIGSVLYEYGGFQLPFLVLGTTLIFATLVSCFLIEEVVDEPNDSTLGMLSMLKIPVIWLMVFAVVICAISLSFFDPTLSDHLKSFDLSTIRVGLMFLLCGGIYTVTAPLWGLLLDRWHCCNSLMFFGSSATVLSMLLVGPSPLLNLEKNLIIIGIALAILGVAAGALYIPTFQNCLDAVKENGYDDSFQTYGYVSGVFQSAFAFGAFLGPTLGGFGVQKLGFEWTTTIIGGINLVFIFTLLLSSIIKCYSIITKRDNPEKKQYRLA